MDVPLPSLDVLDLLFTRPGAMLALPFLRSGFRELIPAL